MGLWSSCAVAGATTITTLLTSNGVESIVTGTPALPYWMHTAAHGAGQSLQAAALQFLIHTGLAAAKYISDTKGLPPERTNPPI